MHSFHIEDFYSYIKQVFNSLNKVHSEFRLPENLCECAWMSPIRDVNVIQFISVRQSRQLLTQQTHMLHFWLNEYSCSLGSFSVLYIVTSAGLSEEQSQPQAPLYSISDRTMHTHTGGCWQRMSNTIYSFSGW